MSLRWACCLLALGLACDEPNGTCEAEGLELLDAPQTPEQQRYNLVLESLRERLQLGIGRYVDGSLPAYRGPVRVFDAYTSEGYGAESDTTLAMAYAVIVDDRAPIDQPLSPDYWPVRELRFDLPDHDRRVMLTQDPRSPAVPLWGQGSTWTRCRGDISSWLDAPERIELDVVCDRDSDGSHAHLELTGDLFRLAPEDIDLEVLSRLRAAMKYTYTPELDGEPSPGGRLTLEEDGLLVTNIGDECYDEIAYRSVTYVETLCLASHGVTELEVGTAQRCCCSGHCHPGEYLCSPL